MRKFDLYMVALKFLEDNDSDVRQAAGKALTNATVSKSIESNQYDANNHISDVSLKVLEGCGVILSSDDIGSALITHLFNILLEKCETIRGATLAVLEEFGYSERATSSSTLLNLSTKRKIFEDEEPNPFEEKLVSCHLVVSILASSCKDTEKDYSLDGVIKKVVSHCIWLCQCLKGRPNFHSLSHDVSSANQVFPCFHGIILGTIAAVYLGFAEEGIVAEARDTVFQICRDFNGGEVATGVHPCIFEALQVLSLAKPNCTETRENLLRCCFLLPGISCVSS